MLQSLATAPCSPSWKRAQCAPLNLTRSASSLFSSEANLTAPSSSSAKSAVVFKPAGQQAAATFQPFPILIQMFLPVCCASCRLAFFFHIPFNLQCLVFGKVRVKYFWFGFVNTFFTPPQMTFSFLANYVNFVVT